MESLTVLVIFKTKNIISSGNFKVIFVFFSRSAKGENKFEITHFSKYNSNKGKAETC